MGAVGELPRIYLSIVPAISVALGLRVYPQVTYSIFYLYQYACYFRRARSIISIVPAISVALGFRVPRRELTRDNFPFLRSSLFYFS